MATREEKIEELKRLRAEPEPELTREEKIAEIRALTAEPSLGTKVEAGVEGFGKEATFGALPFLQAGAEKYITDPLVKFTTGEAPEDVPFKDRVKSFAQRGEALSEEAPGAYLGGQVGGFIAPAVATAGLSSSALKGAQALRASRGIGAGKAAMKTAKLAGLPASEVKALATAAASKSAMASKAKGVGQAAKILAAEGAAFGALQTPQEAIESGEFFSPGERIEGAATGAAFGGALPIVGVAAKSMWNLTKNAPLSAMSVLTNTKTRDLHKYLENPELVRRAENLGKEGVVALVDDVVRPLRQAVELGEIDAKDAERGFNEAQKLITMQFRTDKKLAELSFAEAKRNLDQAINIKRQELKLMPPPLDLVDSVTDGVSKLKNRAIESSKDATDLLVADMNKKGGKIKLSALTDVIDDEMDRLRLFQTGEAPTPETSAVLDRLAKFRDANVASWEGELDPRDVKKILIDLDRNRVNLMNVGAFDGIEQKVYKELRGVIDNQLKDQSEAYREAMLGVQANFELLSMASKSFGDPKRALQKLSNIDKPLLAEDRALLSQLSEITGQDYNTRIKEFMAAKEEMKVLSSKALQMNIIKTMPEFDDFKKAKDGYESLKNLTAMEEARMIDLATASTAEAKLLAETSQKLSDAKLAFEDFAGFTKEGMENKVNALSRSLNSVDQSGIRIREEFKKLSQLSGTDFLELVDALNVAKRFRTEKIQGSRNVNLWGSLAYAGSLATAGGLLAGPMGIAFGAAAGGLVDKFGGRIAQKVLDQVITIKGLPTVQKIRSLELPDAVKRELIDDLEKWLVPAGVRYNLEPEDDKIPLGAGVVPRIRSEVAKRDDLTSLERAEMISSLNESSTLVNAQKFLFGEQEKPEKVRALRRV